MLAFVGRHGEDDGLDTLEGVVVDFDILQGQIITVSTMRMS